MCKLTSIGLSFLFLIQVILPGMDADCELAKLPALYEHYNEHVANEEISLFEFLDLHYGHDQEAMDHNQDEDHESKLPFQGKHQCHHAPVYFTLGWSHALTGNSFFEVSNFSGYKFSLTSNFPDTPFEPPKVGKYSILRA